VTDAGSPLPDVTSSDDAASCPFCEVDAGFYDAPSPALPDALPPPQVDCTDAGMCPLPHSVCVDNQWLEYFDNGVCEDGGCSFDVKMKSCSGYCWDGGCQQSITAPTK